MQPAAIWRLIAWLPGTSSLCDALPPEHKDSGALRLLIHLHERIVVTARIQRSRESPMRHFEVKLPCSPAEF